MIKKVFIIIYFLILLALAIVSILTTWLNEPIKIIILEIIIDIVIMSGVVFAFYNKRIKWWIIPFVLSVIGEVYLLYIDKRVSVAGAIQWTVILMPAVYLNLLATGLIGDFINIIKKK